MLLGLLVHVAKLGVPVRMLGALQRLLGALQRVALLLQQPPDGVIADPMALRRQRLGQLPCGLARPAQRATRIPAGVGVDQPVQRLQQARLALCQSLWPATRTAHAASRRRCFSVRCGAASSYSSASTASTSTPRRYRLGTPPRQPSDKLALLNQPW
jgi:hypothetical protein